MSVCAAAHTQHKIGSELSFFMHATITTYNGVRFVLQRLFVSRLDRSYVKAYYRRGSAYMALALYTLASRDFRTVGVEGERLFWHWFAVATNRSVAVGLSGDDVDRNYHSYFSWDHFAVGHAVVVSCLLMFVCECTVGPHINHRFRVGTLLLRWIYCTQVTKMQPENREAEAKLKASEKRENKVAFAATTTTDADVPRAKETKLDKIGKQVPESGQDLGYQRGQCWRCLKANMQHFSHGKPQLPSWDCHTTMYTAGGGEGGFVCLLGLDQ